MFGLPLLGIAWSWMSSGWVAFALPLLKKVPWQVWAILGAIVLALWYGHVREKRGYDKCHVQVVEATRVEDARRIKAANDSMVEAQKQAAESQDRAIALKDELDKVNDDVKMLKNAKQVCLPKSITDRLNRPRRVSR